jgi:prevent-host-death family protein
MRVSVRTLRDHLSEMFERAARGESVTVTRRGRQIATIVPPDGRSILERGLAEGWISRRVDRPPMPVVRQIPLPGTVTTNELIAARRLGFAVLGV